MGIAPSRTATLAPGLGLAAGGAALAWLASLALPSIPWLSWCVLLGLATGQIPAVRRVFDGRASAGMSLVSKRFLRIGVVLLGFSLSVPQLLSIGWAGFAGTLALVLATFGVTLLLARWLGLSRTGGTLLAAGFSICGASAIAAMSAAIGAKPKDQTTPIALVTLCGTASIGLLPLLWHPLGLDASGFGRWVGASVHDVGQVVATAQIAGTAALALALVVKLNRVILLAPLVAVTAAVQRRADARDGAGADTVTGTQGRRPPIVPLFVAGFLAALAVRSVLPLPGPLLDGIATLQAVLFALALFCIGAAVKLRSLLVTEWRSVVVALGSWLFIASAGYALVQLLS
ncbi:MAG: YeiH family protein [Mycetocola sp.]